MPHDWGPNPGADPVREMRMGLLTSKCKKCGCIKIDKFIDPNSDTFEVPKSEYKPMEWTWNPFKTLKSEPACPARW